MTMFKNIKDFMAQFELACDKSNHGEELTDDDKNFLNLADLHLAKAIMLDWGESAETVAKIILATNL